MRVEFSLKQQLVENQYPQFGIAVPAGTLVGRIYLPKAHQYRNAPSPFAGKVQLIYDSWKSNGSFSGWTHKYNPVRVVEFILKDGIDQSLFLEIAKHFSRSNLKSVRVLTNRLLLRIRHKASLAIQQVKQVLATAIIKVQSVVAEFVDSKPEVQTVTPQTQLLLPPAPAFKVSDTTIRDFILRHLNQEVVEVTPQPQPKPQPLLTPDRKDYKFVTKYKPRTFERLRRYFGISSLINSKNAINIFISYDITPQQIRSALSPKKPKK